MGDAAAMLLQRQLADLVKHPVDGFSAGLTEEEDIFKWEIMIMGSEGTMYEGGMFRTLLTFPREYPLMPPTMRFLGVIPWHPNVYEDGNVCISILHPPGDDKYGYEQASERWLPVHTVTTILLSVISMLADPNDESPANINAGKEWREEPAKFKQNVRRCVRRSQEECFD